MRNLTFGIVETVKMFARNWGILVFTAMLALFSLLQYLAMKKQAEYMRRGLKATLGGLRLTRRSANAAKRSAGALVAAERAWLMAELDFGNSEDGKRDVGKLYKSPTRDEGDYIGVSIFLRAWNDGGVPAWIKRIDAWLIFDTDIPESPPTDAKAGWEMNSPTPISTNGERIVWPINIWGPGWSDTRAQSRLLYGLVQYRDFFGDDLQTWFGYIVDTNGQCKRVAGFPKYNRHE